MPTHNIHVSMLISFSSEQLEQQQVLQHPAPAAGHEGQQHTQLRRGNNNNPGWAGGPLFWLCMIGFLF
jgi:hypothetical protein